MSVRDLVILGCSSQVPTRFRNHGGYLLRWHGEGFLFDPGEGTQRQFIYANVAPTCVTRIFISHFHGDHCLGLASILMRLNLDKVPHVVHCYYPGKYKKYFDRLRYGTVYHEMITIEEHPVFEEGIVEKGELFTIEARFLRHGIENIGWRITEADELKFDKERLRSAKISGPDVRKMAADGFLEKEGKKVFLKEVSRIRPGDSFAYVIDTLPCSAALALAEGAGILLCESTYLESERNLAREHYHLTAGQAAEMARQAGAKLLVLTHFSARYQNLSEFLKEARAIFPHTVVAEDFKTVFFKKTSA